MNWVRGLQTEGLGRKSMCWETNPTSVCFQVCLWVWVSCGESPLGSTFSPLLSLYHSLASQLKIVTFKFRPVRLKYIKTGIKMFPELVLPSSYYCQCSLKSAGVHCCTPTAQLHKSTRLWIKKKISIATGDWWRSVKNIWRARQWESRFKNINLKKVYILIYWPLTELFYQFLFFLNEWPSVILLFPFLTI